MHPDIATWRMPGPDPDCEEEIWHELDSALLEQGITQWKCVWGCDQMSPDGAPLSAEGYAYITKASVLKGRPTFKNFRYFRYTNPVCRAVRTKEGRDCVLRVIRVGDDGKQHLEILRLIATGLHALAAENHTLPMIREITIENATFGLFPRIGDGTSLSQAYGYWAKNSVGDILDMVLQALEGLIYIHNLGVAHRDTFKDNFHVQWHPESLVTRNPLETRPRVCLLDFETAVMFPADRSPAERLCDDVPFAGCSDYQRPRIPEMDKGLPYDPFALDIWQFGLSFIDFQSTFSDVDEVFLQMRRWPSPPSAKKAYSALVNAVARISPNDLLVPPLVDKEKLGSGHVI